MDVKSIPAHIARAERVLGEVWDGDPSAKFNSHRIQLVHAHALVAIAKALVDIKAAIVMSGPR